MSSDSFFKATTYLGPLTTTFTPPASCLGTTAAVDSDGVPFHMYIGGVGWRGIVQAKSNIADCYPKNYPAIEGAAGAYFSPGVCPAGYTTGATMVEGLETRAICCLSGIKANNILDCTTEITDRILTASEYFTVAPIRIQPIQTGVKSGGSIVLIGSAIEIRYRAGGNPAPTQSVQTPGISTESSTSTSRKTGPTTTFQSTQTTLIINAQTTATSRANSSVNGRTSGTKIAILLFCLILFFLG